LPKKHIRHEITDKNHIVTKPPVSHRIDTSEILDRAIKNANKGMFEEAEVLLLDIIKVDNLNIDTYFLLASIAEEKRDYQRAEDAIRKIIYINPNHPIAYFRLGNLLIRSGRTEEAKKAFSTALTLFQTVDDDTILQGSDGMHIERLKKICQSMITEINLK
ncbi:MAG: tetratricopeptide repeat protein, partial [Thermodesulfovibrionales bacterium]|nr:tetratricopeptide repeat protein [Thermodesulfovibrionales bacterium]